MNAIEDGPERLDPNAHLPIEVIVGTLFRVSVETWRQTEPDATRKPTRAGEVLDLLVRWAPPAAVADLRQGLAGGDPRALATLAAVEDRLRELLEIVSPRLIAQRDAKAWNVLREESELTAAIADALGDVWPLANARLLQALAARASRDVLGAIEAYQSAIETLAGAPHGEHMSAVAYDNLGNLLGEVGQLDEAVAAYDAALRFETQPDGTRSILANQANALAALGEYQAAVGLYEQIIAALDDRQPDPRRLAAALDNAGQSIRLLGDLDKAGELLERARALWRADDLGDRAVNALARSDLARDRKDEPAAATAFREAHDLEFARARAEIDRDHYREGFKTARAGALPMEQTMALLAGSLAPSTNPLDPFQPFVDAAAIARDRGDVALALRIDANLAGRLFDVGAVDRAVALAWRIQNEANELGLAYAECAALATLGSLIAQGVDADFPLGPLTPYAFATTLFDLHLESVEDADLDPDTARLERFSTGALDNELGLLASRHGAYDLAVGYMERAVTGARAPELSERLLNRLAGLAYAKEHSGDRDGARSIDAELLELLAAGDVSPRGEIVARRAIAHRLAATEPERAIEQLRAATNALEHLRATTTGGGLARAEIARQFGGLASMLADLLRQQGDHAAAFDALQGDKARRTMAVLADLHGDSDRPATANEIGALLPADGLLIDLAVAPSSVTAYVVSPGGAVAATTVEGDPEELTVEFGDVRDRQEKLVRCVLRNATLTTLAGELTNGERSGKRIFLVPDGPFHNLPVHATPIGDTPWYERAPVAQLPAAGILRFPTSGRVQQLRCYVAGDSHGDLPQAAAEIAAVAMLLGTEARGQKACTRAALEQMLTTDELDIVHLAVHGRGDVRRGGRASLLFAADTPSGVEWVPFDALAQLPWRARLVVFSGCSTAVTGPRQGSELVGVARAALEAGAGAVIASLWPVGDEPAKVMMTAFYRSLRAHLDAGVTDIRVPLDDARGELRSWLQTTDRGDRHARDGREWPVEGPPPAAPGHPPPEPTVANALEWAPFVLVGNPLWA